MGKMKPALVVAAISSATLKRACMFLAVFLTAIYLHGDIFDQGDQELKFRAGKTATVESVRDEIIGAVWSGAGLPTAGVDNVETGVESPASISQSNLLRVDRLTISRGEVVSRPHVWVPIEGNGKIAIYHAGHSTVEASWRPGRVAMASALLDAGYTVVAIYMPFAEAGVIDLTQLHNELPEPTEEFNALSLFVEPVVRVINHFDGLVPVMVGVSGGGWTTALVSAIDTRIRASVQIAGSMPSYMRADEEKPSRDWEQYLPGISPDIADYLDLYAMATDDGRKQIQILNDEDTCCFKASRYYSHLPYGGAISEATDGRWSW